MFLGLRLDRFGTLQISVRQLQRELVGRVPRNASAERVEPRPIEIVAVFVRLPTGKSAAFELHIFPNRTERRHAECDVG